MPMILVPIPETTESVTRPVMLDVIRQLMQWSGISNKTNIVYFGDVERSKQLESAIGSSKDDPNTFAHNDKISLEVSENYNIDRLPNEAMYDPENLFVFHDAPLNIIMKPVYAQMDASISVKFRANNKNQAIQWRDYMKAKISQRRELYIHNVSYAFGIPGECLYILQELHRLRENVAGFGEDFDTYFANNRTPKMTMLTNMSGTASLWAVPETQTRIQGWFDWEIPEEAVRDGATETYTISFTYKFRYARPTSIAMMYPIVVHNQLLDQKFRDIPLTDQNDLEVVYSRSGRILKSFEGARFKHDEVMEFGFSIPTFDEFLPKMVPPNTRRLLTILFTLDPANPTQCLNLNQLGSRQLSPEILAYILDERPYLLQPGYSAINLGLYKNEFLISPDTNPITIDDNFNVIGNFDQNFRVQYHLRLSVFTDLQSLRGGALSRLQDHGKAAIQILMAIDPTLKRRGFLPALIDDNFVCKTSLLIAIANIRPAQPTYVDGPSGMMYTVQSLFVEALPRTA